MKSVRNLIFTCLSVAFLFSSCSRKNDIGKMIPGDALMVAHLDVNSLTTKLPWKDVQQTSWYQQAYADTSVAGWNKKILDDPSITGIDLKEGLVIFMAKGPDRDFYVAAEGKIKNAGDFEQFNKNFDATQTVKKEGKINLLTLKGKSVVGWDGDRFVYVASTESPSARIDQWNDQSGQQGPSADPTTALTAIVKHLFALSSDHSLEKNEKFATLLKEPGDIHVWQNTTAIIQNSSSMGMLGMLNLDALTSGNIVTYSINFLYGTIAVNQKGYVSKALADILKKALGSTVNMDMIKNIPSTNVIGLLATSFKPEGLVDIIKLLGADGFVNTYAQQMGFTLEDLSRSTNGDMVLSLSDFKINTDSASKSPVSFNYIFSVGIGDKGSLQKVVDAGKKITSEMGQDSTLNYAMNDKTFALSNSHSFLNNYLSGNNNTYDFSAKMSGHPVGFFLDIHTLLTEFSHYGNSADPDHQEMLKESLNTWKNIISTGGDFKDTSYSFKTEVNLVNKDTNSLKVLNHYIDNLFKIEEARKAQSTHRLDSLLVPPPIDTVKVK